MRSSKVMFTGYPFGKFIHFVAKIASAFFIAAVFYVVLTGTILHGSADGSSLNLSNPAALLESLPPQEVGAAADTKPSEKLLISLLGANPLQEQCGEPFSDPGATATNGAGKTVPVQVSGKVDSQALGTYTLTYSATDDRDSTSVERIVNIVDTTPPEIALEGATTMTVFCAGAFVEPGASATDSCQGKLPVTISGAVDPSLPGTYDITYTATDAYNNTRIITRKVIVGSIEDNPPTITLNGDAEITIECGGSFTDPGATANTACSGSVPVTTSGNVDVNKVGSYTITYAASTGDLMAEASRAVSIVDTTAPLISLKGSSPMSIVRGSTFTDPGAIARDGCAGGFAASASGTVDQNTIGSYTITYTASDPSENQATPVKRTVNVVDAPEILTASHNPLWVIAVLVLKVSSLGGF